MRTAIVALLVVAAAGLLAVLANRPPSRPGAAESPRAAPAPAAAPPAAPPSAAVATAPAPPTPPAQAAPSAAAAAPQPPPLPRDPNALLRALEPLRREVFGAVADQHWRVERCDVPVSSIHVTVESIDGGVRIVDARVDAPPAAEGSERDPAAVDPAAQECVRSALVRNVIAAPSARPGRSWEMPFAPGPID